METLEINLTKIHTYDQIVDSRIKDFKKVFLQKLAWFRVLRQGISIAGDVIVVALIGWPVLNVSCPSSSLCYTMLSLFSD